MEWAQEELGSNRGAREMIWVISVNADHSLLLVVRGGLLEEQAHSRCSPEVVKGRQLRVPWSANGEIGSFQGCN